MWSHIKTKVFARLHRESKHEGVIYTLDDCGQDEKKIWFPEAFNVLAPCFMYMAIGHMVVWRCNSNTSYCDDYSFFKSREELNWTNSGYILLREGYFQNEY